MDSIYLTSLLVGGFFVLLSIFGGGESDHDADHDFDHDIDVDADHDFDSDFSVDLDGSPDFVDLLSLRALFLFAAFFGLTGVTLQWFGTAEPLTGLLAGGTGLLVGLGGNFIIKKFAYEQVSSQVTEKELPGKTATVLLPMAGQQKGKILLTAGGKRMELTARLFEGGGSEILDQGAEVVVVRMKGRIAEVLRPD